MLPPIWSAVRTFFKQATWVEKNVPTVFAQPDRAFAEMKREMLREARKTNPKATPEDMEKVPVPRPFMSVWLQQPKFDPSRFSPAVVRAYQKDLANGTAKSMRRARPVKCEVQVDLWCGVGGQLIGDSVEGQIELRFVAESVYLPVDWTLAKWYRQPFNLMAHAAEFGRTKVRLIGDGWTDTSDLEQGEDQKEVRRSWVGQVEADLPYRPIEGRLVREVAIAIYQGTDPDTATQIASVTSGGED